MTERATRVWTASLMLAAALCLMVTRIDALDRFTLPLWGISLLCMVTGLVIVLRHNLSRESGMTRTAAVVCMSICAAVAAASAAVALVGGLPQFAVSFWALAATFSIFAVVLVVYVRTRAAER